MKIVYPDQFSFEYSYKEIFIDKIYDGMLDCTSIFGVNIIDCGANIGLSSLWFDQNYGHSAKILAFEPSSAFKYLEQNVKGNNNITIVNKALSSEKGKMKFYEEKDKIGSLLSRFDSKGFDDMNKKFVEKIVIAVKLSDYIKEHIDLLKIDVEGAEGDILIDIMNTGKINLIDNMIIEVHHNVEKVSKIVSILSSLKDFDVRFFADKKLTRKNQDVILYCKRRKTC